MGAVQLLPGGGARYTSEAFTSAKIGADEIDCSFCSELAVQQIVTGTTVGGNFQLEERLSGLDGWAQLGSAIAVGTTGTLTKFNATQRPFGHVRIDTTNVTGLDTNDTLQFRLQGGRVAGGSIF
jgi:hypothetical protein